MVRDKVRDKDLRELDGIGDEVIESLTDYFQEERTKALLARFKAQGLWPKGQPRPAAAEAGALPLAGQRVLVTGTISGMTRDQVKEAVKRAGGVPVSSVSKKLSFLVVGEKPGQSKLDKARELGLTVIGQDEFLRRLQGAGPGFAVKQTELRLPGLESK